MRLQPVDPSLAVQMYESGRSMVEIAATVGRSRIMVRRILEAQGITIRSRTAHWNTPDRATRDEQIAAMARAGRTFQEIKAFTGVGERTLYEIADRLGVRIQRPRKPGKSKEERAAALAQRSAERRAATAHRNEEMRRLYESSESVEAIAHRFGVFEHSVRMAASDGKWHRPRRVSSSRPRKRIPRAIPSWATNEVRRLYETGASRAELCLASGRKDNSIAHIAKRWKWDAAARRAVIQARYSRDLRRCTMCQTEKERDAFYVTVRSRANGKTGMSFDSRCKDCSRHRARLRDERLAIAGPLTMAEVCQIFATAKRCAYCDRRLASHQKTLDHILPISRGGEHARENVTIACSFCNTSKGARTPLEWLLSGCAPDWYATGQKVPSGLLTPGGPRSRRHLPLFKRFEGSAGDVSGSGQALAGASCP